MSKHINRRLGILGRALPVGVYGDGVYGQVQEPRVCRPVLPGVCPGHGHPPRHLLPPHELGSSRNGCTLPGGRTSAPCSPGGAAGATDQRKTHAGFGRGQLGLRGVLQAGLERSVGKERLGDGLIPSWALGSSLVPSTGGGDREHRCPLERAPTLKTDVGPSVTQVGPPDQVR